MHDNTPSHAARLNEQFLEGKRVSGERIMEWPPQNSDLNPIENLWWSIVKRKVYEGGKQYNSKSDVWEAITCVYARI